MYKVYLNPLTCMEGIGIKNFGLPNHWINQIVDEIKKYLIKEGNYVVYTKKENMTAEQIINDNNEISPNIYVAINTSSETTKGIEVYTKVGCEISNGYAKETYKELSKVYYDKQIDNGVIYKDKVVELMKIDSPAILINLGCNKNKHDVDWIVNNITGISLAIEKGIVKATKLRPC